MLIRFMVLCLFINMAMVKSAYSKDLVLEEKIENVEATNGRTRKQLGLDAEAAKQEEESLRASVLASTRASLHGDFSLKAFGLRSSGSTTHISMRRLSGENDQNADLFKACPGVSLQVPISNGYWREVDIILVDVKWQGNECVAERLDIVGQ